MDRIQKATGFTVYHNNTDFHLEKMDNDNETDKMLKMLQMLRMPRMLKMQQTLRLLQMLRMLQTELRIQKAVIVLVKPTDIGESSLQHGKDLSRHEQLFELLFNESKLKKISCTYDTIYDAQKWVHDEMNNYMNGGRW